jgi:hypothetical protein
VPPTPPAPITAILMAVPAWVVCRNEPR